MNHLRIIALACGVLLGISLAHADATVSTVEELTNALLTATGKITLKAGVYDVSGLTPQTPKNTWGGKVSDVAPAYLLTQNQLTIVGENTEPWYTKTSAQETVILCTNACAALFYGYAGAGRKSTFAHLTFDGGNCANVSSDNGGNNGGAIHFNGPSTGYATNCVFRNCRAAYGGATYAVAAYGCLYSNCTSTVQGGGAYVTGSSNYNSPTNVIRNCTFIDCASVKGGAVYTSNMQDYGTPNAGCVAGSTFIRCTATEAGGAIYAERQGLIADCTFRTNASPVGAVYSLENNKDVYHGIITNCHFYANEACTAKQTFGGAVNTWALVKDCSFIGNSATNGGAVAYAQVVHCAFTNNFAIYGGAVYKLNAGSDLCSFYGNQAQSSGGAVYDSTLSNCLFVTNCALGNRGGACSGATIYRSVFRDNYSAKNRGGAADSSYLTDCVFSNNYVQSTARGGAACYSHCRGCHFSGVGDVSGGTLLNCVLDGVTRIHNVTPNFVLDAVCNGNSPFAATNCLITHCLAIYLANNDGSKMELVNCTFADNILPWDTSTYCIRAANNIDYSDAKRPTYAATSVVINCVFSGNTIAGGKAADLKILGSMLEPQSVCLVSNALWTAGYVAAGNVETSGLIQGAARFVGVNNRHYPDAAPYMIRPGSAACDCGLSLAWPAGMTDLAGNARVAGAAVDLGCYECNLQPVGTIILFR